MLLLFSSIGFLLRIVLLGSVLRALVAFYLGIWKITEPSTIINSFSGFFYGWHFDLSIGCLFYLILYWLTIIFSLPPKQIKRVNFLLLFTYIVMIITDALYAKESGRHLSYEVRSLFTVESSVLNLVGRYWLQVVIALISTSFLNLWLAPIYRPSRGFIGKVFSVLTTAAIAVVGFRGFEGIPQDISWAYRAAGGYQGAVLALNGAYGIFWAVAGPENNSKEQVNSGAVKTTEIYKKWREGRGISNPIGNFDGNIVVVFLEGWPATDMNRFENGTEITPFFNKLREESLRTELMFAGGHRTTEGLFASLCSLPNPLGKSIMYSAVEGKDFVCLPRLLGNKGYSSAFFQGSDQFTSGVGLLVLKTGFQASYGKREIPDWENIERNAWGVYDETLYDFVLGKMDKMKEPLLVGINTNTTHDQLFPAKADRTKYKSVRQWADHELEDFYKKLQSRKWEKDWLLVLVADHTTYSGATIIEKYAVPFLMKHHSVKMGGMTPLKHELVQGAFFQPDIAATLADFTGIKAPNFLGRSLLRPQSFNPGASVFHLGQAAWFDGDWSVVFNIRQPGEKKCFKWREDPSLIKAQECPANGEDMYETGLSYIKESQEDLFR